MVAVFLLFQQRTKTVGVTAMNKNRQKDMEIK